MFLKPVTDVNFLEQYMDACSTAGKCSRTKLKIAMVAACPFPTSQGSQVLIRQLAETFHARGHEVHLVVYHLSEPFSLPCHFRIHRIPRVTAYSKLRAGPSFKKPVLDLALTIKLAKVIREFGLSVIYAHNYEAALAGFLVREKLKLPVLYHSHNAMIDELHTYFKSPFFRSLALKTAGVLDRNIPPRADFCIVLNDTLSHYLLKKGVSRHRHLMVPPGTFPEEFLRTNQEEVREKFRLKGRSVVIYTGNLDRYQNLELLFNAFEMAVKDIPEALLLLVSHSKPGEYQKRADRIKAPDSVRFIESHSFEEVGDLLGAADLTVIPRTSWSGYPIKLLNYMAAGKAVIASEGSAKGITHMENGYVVENRDVKGLAGGIRFLLKNPEIRTELGRSALEWVEKHHNWDRIVQNIEEVCQALIYGAYYQRK